MRDLIIKYIDGWNEKNNGAMSRDELRRLLGWFPGIDNEKSLGELIVEQVENGQSQNLPAPTSAPASERAYTTDSVRKAIIEVVENRKIITHAVNAILSSNWNFIDSSGLMQKSPEEVISFLKDLSHTVVKFDDMHPNRKKYLQMIFDAYLRSN